MKPRSRRTSWRMASLAAVVTLLAMLASFIRLSGGPLIVYALVMASALVPLIALLRMRTREHR